MVNAEPKIRVDFYCGPFGCKYQTTRFMTHKRVDKLDHGTTPVPRCPKCGGAMSYIAGITVYRNVMPTIGIGGI